MITFQITWKYKTSPKTYTELVQADTVQEAKEAFMPSEREEFVSIKAV